MINRANKLFSVILSLVLLLTFIPNNVEAANTDLVINEIESNDPNGGTDWVELYNPTDEPMDISGLVLSDDKGFTRLADGKTAPFPQGTVIEAKGFYVVETEVAPYDFGLGKADEASLRDKDGNIVDQYSWTAHATDTYSRVPDGTGEFIDYANTYGVKNVVVGPNSVVINEIESTNSDRDWVEIYNRGTESVDISGWRISDGDVNDETHYSIPLPEGTILEPNSYFVFEGDIPGDIKHFSFGLGSSDSAFLYDAQNTVIDSHSWQMHANDGLSRIPNGTGDFKDVSLTKGAVNQDAAPVEEIPLPELSTEAFPGKQTHQYVDESPTFMSDSSGLDIVGDTLWAVDNGTATVWKMTIGDDGVPTLSEGWESGKKASFIKDAGNASAAGPDAEGITADASGNLFIAAERDNSLKAENKNIILQVDPNSSSDNLTTLIEWDITDLIDNARKDRGLVDYKVPNNEGIETVEWIPNSVLEGNIIDQNTNAPYVSSNYNSLNGGLFFTGVENDGYIYVFSLSSDGSKTLISQIDTGMGMVIGLDYNEPTGALWALADNGRDNTIAKITFNGTENPDALYYQPPADFVLSENNEGFAIAKML